ncbi:MAG: ATP-binding protein [Candidatus Omnitrophica bacterium]|nr:ATP-binding protein [Candidatus Omnitrophota bacterium]
MLSKIVDYVLDEGKIFDIKLCIEEAVRNAIVHGNNCDRRRLVKIASWVEDDNLHIEIEDEGKGFDQSKLVDPTSEAHIFKNSGRGVYLIKKLMDKVEYTAGGRRITMVKNLK